jgi:hypothetical protein
MTADRTSGSTERQRWAKVRAAAAAGLTILQAGVWYPVVDSVPDELDQRPGRVWVEVRGELWSLPEDQLEVREEPGGQDQRRKDA